MGLGALSLPGWPISPPRGQCVAEQPWLQTLTHYAAPLMRGCPGCRRRRARATGLSPVGPPWVSVEAAQPRGWCVPLCATTALAGALPSSCVCDARARSGGSGPVMVLSFPLGLLPPLAYLAVRVAGCPIRVSLPLACWYANPCGLYLPRARSGRPSGPHRVPVACACAHAPAAFAPPPPRVGVARAARAVLGQGARRAVQGGSCPSAFPAPVPCSALFVRGGGSVPALPCLALGCAPPSWKGLCVRGGPVPGGVCGGGPFAAPPGGVVGSGSVGGSQGAGAGGSLCLGLSLCLTVRASMRASLASLCPWRVWSPYCSGSCPHAPVLGQSEGGAAEHPCAPAGGWLAGWLGGQRRTLPRSLWERSGQVTVRGRAARGPWGARLRAHKPPPGGRGGGAPLACRGGTGPTSPSRPPALRGLGRRGGGAAAPR